MKLTGNEFDLIKGFVEKHCGIHLDPGKEYLIETRLTDIAIENECRSFFEFYQKALADTSGKLRNRIVDAMTTNETYFFRDDNLWNYMKEVALPELLRKAATGPVRVWSAAASTGQEAYSVAMMFDELARAQGFGDSFQLIGSQKDQVARIGNSVCPPMARALVAANVAG